jgi:hypothetical protein
LQVFDPGGGATVAEATRIFGNGMILSSVSEPGLDKTAEASGDGFKIFQLYVRGDSMCAATPNGSTTMSAAPSTRALTPFA